MRTTTTGRSVLRVLAAALAVSFVLGGREARAQPPNYGHDFVTVDAPRNRRPTREEAPGFYPPQTGPNFVPPGRVDHRFRITRTEVTVSQWFEFVVAYAPYWEGRPGELGFTSDWIWYRNGRHQIQPGAENYSANMSWHNAARYANWLVNGKRTERWAFENGAYDTSTFVPNPNGTRNDQLAHTPGAAFWIPTFDEMVKAAYYDPDRYGPGQGGYWLYPNRSNTGLLSGHPWQGGETNAGIPNLYPGEYNVGSYPHVRSPWGLLDVSGGVREWTETTWDIPTRNRVVRGTFAGLSGPPFFDDELDNWSQNLPHRSSTGLRIASAVPSPSACAAGLLLSLAALRRRR